MIDELRAMAVFAKTVETGSFRAAAKALGLAPSVVSHHVARLEARLGVALLYRSTRRLSLTHDGEHLFASAQTMLAAAEHGLNAIVQRAVEPAGRLSLSVPAMLARDRLTADLAAFANAHRKIELSIRFSDRPHDVVREGIDLAIRIGDLADSGLKSKRLFVLERTLVAAPALLAAVAQPAEPADLAGWDWIGLTMRPNSKTLINADGDIRRISFSPRVVVDSIEAVCQLAIAGVGLATPPASLVAEDLRTGRLVQPLPGWVPDALGVYALWPANAPREGLTFRLLRFLNERQPPR